MDQNKETPQEQNTPPIPEEPKTPAPISPDVEAVQENPVPQEPPVAVAPSQTPIMQNSETSPVQPSVQPPQEPIKKKSPIFTIALIMLLIGILSLAGYFIWTKYLGGGKPETTPTPIAVITPTTTPDPTMDWKIYTNMVENFSFRYPPTWIIDVSHENGDENQENIKLSLTKESSKIDIIADMVGIGGIGKDLEGTNITIDENELYKYRSENLYEGSKVVGVTTSLTGSLGVFDISGKTYSITLKYPDTYDSTQSSQLEDEFDLILSTFAFPETIILGGPTSTPSAKMQ